MAHPSTEAGAEAEEVVMRTLALLALVGAGPAWGQTVCPNTPGTPCKETPSGDATTLQGTIGPSGCLARRGGLCVAETTPPVLLPTDICPINKAAVWENNTVQCEDWVKPEPSPPPTRHFTVPCDDDGQKVTCDMPIGVPRPGEMLNLRTTKVVP